MIPNWTTKGKTWNGLGPLKSHLRQFCNMRGYNDIHTIYNNIPENWEVVKIKYVEEDVETLNAKDLYPLKFKD